MERDFSAELNELQGQMNAAQRRLGELEGAKQALAPQRSTIVALCQKLNIEPKREAIAAAIAAGEAELADTLKTIDADLKKEHV